MNYAPLQMAPPNSRPVRTRHIVGPNGKRPAQLLRLRVLRNIVITHRVSAASMSVFRKYFHIGRFKFPPALTVPEQESHTTVGHFFDFPALEC